MTRGKRRKKERLWGKKMPEIVTILLGGERKFATERKKEESRI